MMMMMLVLVERHWLAVWQR